MSEQNDGGPAFPAMTISEIGKPGRGKVAAALGI